MASRSSSRRAASEDRGGATAADGGGSGITEASAGPRARRRAARAASASAGAGQAFSAAPGSQSARVRRKSAIELFDEELAQLRPGVAGQAERCRKITQELAVARETEKLERQALMKSRDFRKERADKLTKRLQACIRGWLRRKRFVLAINTELAAEAGFASLLPDQLRDQLRVLKHTVHDLKYQGEHRERAIIRLQAFWRGMLGRRVVRVLWVSNYMRQVYLQMDLAATRISAWHRSVSTRLKYREVIYTHMRETSLRQFTEMVEGLKIVVKLQRAFRARLAVRNVTRRRSAAANILNGCLGMVFTLPEGNGESDDDSDDGARNVDSWRPGGLLGDSRRHEASLSSSQGLPEPRSDRELKKLEEAGLTPFYWSSSHELVRHRIGGSKALKMGRRLGIGEADEWTPPSDDELDCIGGLWDVYPEGLSADFLEKLDEDAWPWPRKAARKAKKPAQKPAKRPAAPQPPPVNSERRAIAREEAEASKAVVAAAAALAAGPSEECHPLFDNAPPLPPLAPAPPRTLPPRTRPRPQRDLAAAVASARAPSSSAAKSAAAGKDCDDEDASWGAARSFFHTPSGCHDQLPRLIRGGGAAAIAAAAAMTPLALAW